MKRWIPVVLGLGAVGAMALVGLVASQPDELKVERSRVIAASPEVVWVFVSDLRQFTEWDPWSDMDPTATLTYSDPSLGAGAWYTWKGGQIGSGKMAVVAEKRPERVDHDLQFIEPFASRADVALILEPAEGGTRVRWTMTSAQGWISKAMCLVVDMDAMLGADFDKGLASLAQLAETEERRHAAKRIEAAPPAEAAPAAEPEVAPAEPAPTP
jgi:uncharacterized protein YndB with AHSA1/START domain